MKPSPPTIAGIILLAAMPMVSAATSLRDTMHAWKPYARNLVDMAAGKRRFDPAAATADLKVLVADSAAIQAGLTNTSTADARDFKARFVAFHADAEAALGMLGNRPALKSQVARMQAECSSCHDAYRD